MENITIYKKLPGSLLPWYDREHRDLPWRGDNNPYHIWLSEIMLQQTRVEAVKGYYARFLSALPTIASLATADDELLHKLWEGLGYYSRVRNLKKAAQKIVSAHNGVFPRRYEDVRALSGIGDYTAGAICSIAFNQPTPAVDGNVLRVISRLTDDDTPIDLPAYKQKVQRNLAQVYPQQAGDFTQALMELGATVCGPNRKPDCEKCPCRDFCKGRKSGKAEVLPVKRPKMSKKIQEMTVFILNCDNRYAVEKRPSKGLLAGLWQFPNVPGKMSPEEALGVLAQKGWHPKEIFRQVDRSHIFTHIRWEMRGYYISVAEEDPAYAWLEAEEIVSQVALPTAFRQFWDIQ